MIQINGSKSCFGYSVELEEETPMDTIDQLDHRLKMMGKMLRATERSLSEASGLGKLGKLNAMANNCLECQSSKACETWLKQDQIAVNAPSFCPNAKLINRQ